MSECEYFYFSVVSLNLATEAHWSSSISIVLVCLHPSGHVIFSAPCVFANKLTTAFSFICSLIFDGLRIGNGRIQIFLSVL